jgi:DNA-3-methyladenine glycosylase
MQRRRGPAVALRDLARGPGRLGQALGITRAHDGLALDAPPFTLQPRTGAAPQLVSGPRIGISKARDAPWRFGLAGSPYLSRPFPAG